jgi:tRNA dimethylallyltransferase
MCERTLGSAVEQSQRDVRHYAKRQMTWFRREEGVIWLDGFGDEQTGAKIEAILDKTAPE